MEHKFKCLTKEEVNSDRSEAYHYINIKNMSVYRNDYIMYGWKLPHNINKDNPVNLRDEKFSKYLDGEDENNIYRIIRDGIADAYTVFGAVICESGDDYEGWDFKELKPDMLSEEAIMTKYREIFNHEPKTYPSRFIFTHFW